MMSVRFWIAATVVLAASICVPVAFATPTGTSISINFGADQPSGDATSLVEGAAGLAGTVNWNNLETEVGDGQALVMDVNGVSTASTATISWESNNTWASTGNGEENNTAPEGNDRNLMTGYLDTNNTSVTQVTVTGLDEEFAAGYNVAIYTQGGVNGRGGQYTITTPSLVGTLSLTNDSPFDGTYIPGGDPGNNYLVLAGFTDPEFTITATPTTGSPPRAPINGIEIVAVPIPEPSTVALLGLGILGLVGLARRRRR